jgi:hypothetical protein
VYAPPPVFVAPPPPAVYVPPPAPRHIVHRAVHHVAPVCRCVQPAVVGGPARAVPAPLHDVPSPGP